MEHRDQECAVRADADRGNVSPVSGRAALQEVEAAGPYILLSRLLWAFVLRLKVRRKKNIGHEAWMQRTKIVLTDLPVLV